MSQVNPYEAPRADLSEARHNGTMNPALERLIAARMLQARDQGGYSIGLFLRWNVKKYLLSIMAAVLNLLIFGFWLSLWPLVLVLAGFLAGEFVRDFGWFEATKRAWPLTVKVIDWPRLRAIADGVEVDLSHTS
jgi:hypothetical protein